MAKRVDPKKEEQEHLQNILLELLKEEENKYCADCGSKTPRWASWNLGVFICIKCAGIHRNLGVHISKVRSVNLDTWTPEQVQSMRVMGNELAKKVYEHSLPESHRRPMSDHQLETFIRAKYEHKRYILNGFTYPKIDVNDLPKRGQPTTRRTPAAVIKNTHSSPAHSAPAARAAPPAAAIPNLLDFSAPEPTTPATAGGGSLFDDFASLSMTSTATPGAPSPPLMASAAANDSDDFGSFVSAGAPTAFASSAAPQQVSPVGAAASSGLDGLFGGDPTPAASATAESDLMGLASSSGGVGGIDEKRTNADILALFGGAPAQPVTAPGGFSAFGIQVLPKQQQTPVPQQTHAPLAASNSNPLAGLVGFGAPPVQQPMGMGGGMPGMVMPPMGMMGGVPPMSGAAGMPPGAFPNPFGAPGGMAHPPQGFGGFAPMAAAAPAAAPLSTPGFSTTPMKSNAFADLSIGNVMSAMKTGKPLAASAKTNGASSTAAKPAVDAATMNFDDLLGL